MIGLYVYVFYTQQVASTANQKSGASYYNMAYFTATHYSFMSKYCVLNVEKVTNPCHA